jgi:hypothetical protein
VNIRTATLSDWDHISNISKKSGYIDYISQIGPSYINDGTVIVGEDSGTITGFLKIEELIDNTSWLGGLRVHPDFRRKGIAMQLTREAVNMGKVRGHTATRILISTDNVASIELSKKSGFKIISEQLFFSGFPDVRNGKIVSPVNDKLINYGWKYGYWTIDEFGPKVDFVQEGNITYSLMKEEEQQSSYVQIISGEGEIELDGEGITSIDKRLTGNIKIKGNPMEGFTSAYILEIKL